MYYSCYLPTGQICWLCEKHSAQPRVTIMSTEQRAPISSIEQSAHLLTIKENIEKLAHLRQPYIDRRPEGLTPRKFQFLNDGICETDKFGQFGPGWALLQF
jgi:hypothetical protein